MSSSSETTMKALRAAECLQDLEQLLEDIKNKPTRPTNRQESLPSEIPVSARKSISKHTRIFVREKPQNEFPFLSGQMQFSRFIPPGRNIRNYTQHVNGAHRRDRSDVGAGLNSSGRLLYAGYERGSLLASYHRRARACYLAGRAPRRFASLTVCNGLGFQIR